MYIFLGPLHHGGVYKVSIVAETVEAAFEEFRTKHYRERQTGSLGLWQYSLLVGRVLQVWNNDEQRHEPLLQMFPA